MRQNKKKNFVIVALFVAIVSMGVGYAALTLVLTINGTASVGDAKWQVEITDIKENAFLIPTKALRDEGTSYHYLPSSRYIELNQDMVRKIKSSFDKQGIPYEICTTWTTDGFFRETQEMVQYRLNEGCSVVEMECAALAACAEKRGAMYGQFFFTADSLANVMKHEERGWGITSHEKALQLALELACDL